jgi:hypothetical protein
MSRITRKNDGDFLAKSWRSVSCTLPDHLLFGTLVKEP